MSSRIAEPRAAYSRMCERWALLEDLMGGTLTMRLRASTWLPQEDGETAGQYSIRLRRTILFEGFKDTIESLCAKPFSEAISVKNPPEDERFEPLFENTDGESANLDEFAKGLFHDMLFYGILHFLVDFSSVDPDEVQTQADEEAAGARVTFTRVCPTTLIGWGWNPDGTLNHIRIKSVEERMDNETFEEKTVNVIRVYRENVIEIWESGAADGEYEKVAESPNSLGRVPLVTRSAHDVTGQFEAEPPFERLAWMNLQHYQLSSDRMNTVRNASFGIYFMSGVSDQEREELQTTPFGPTTVLASTRNDADMKTVEFTGSAANIAKEAIEDTEAQMQILGLKPRVDTSTSSRETATGKRIDASRSETQAEAWTRSLERALHEGFELAAEWYGTTLPEGFTLTLSKNFGVALEGLDRQVLILLYKEGLLTRRQVLSEMKRRGELDGTLDIGLELEEAQKEFADRSTEGVEIPDSEVVSTFKWREAAGTPPVKVRQGEKPPGRTPVKEKC